MKKWFWAVTAAVAVVFAAMPALMQEKEERNMAMISSEKALEDYDYMWKVLEENYPFLKLAERKYLLSADALKKNYRSQIEALGEGWIDFDVFYGLMEQCVGKFQGLGHLRLFTPAAYEEAVRACEEAERQGMRDAFTDWCKTIYDDPVVKKRYNYLKTLYPTISGTSGISEKENLIFKEIDEKTAYVKIKSFALHRVEKDRESLEQWFIDNARTENLIIDISENGGGTDYYWMELLVAPNIDRPMESEAYYVTPYGEESREPYAAMGITEDSFERDLDALRALPAINEEDLEGIRYYRKTRRGVVPASDQRICEGRFFVLTGEKTYSAAEGFAMFCKDTGFATLVGENTGGDGGGNNVFPAALPNSGLIIFYRAMHSLNPDGSSNVEFGTTPDVMADRKTTGEISYLGICLDYIRNME